MSAQLTWRKNVSDNFRVLGVDYRYLARRPNPRACFGIALTFWHTNVQDLLFSLHYINTWPGRELIDVSVCSHAAPPEEALPLCNYAIHCAVDRGHQDGTTLHCNGAVHPLLEMHRIKAFAHTDADAIIVSPAYFFGWAALVVSLNKALLTSTNSFLFDPITLKKEAHPELGPGCTTDQQFGSFFVVNARLARNTTMFPIVPRGNFESDRFRQFHEARFTLDDVIVLDRREFLSPAKLLLRNMDFSLGVMHNTNARDGHDEEDRKTRLCRIMGISKHG